MSSKIFHANLFKKAYLQTILFMIETLGVSGANPMQDANLAKYLSIAGANIDRLRGGEGAGSLAKRAGVSRSTVEAAMKGKEISFKNLVRIANALNVSLPDLFITDLDRGEISYKHKLLMELLDLKPKKE